MDICERLALLSNDLRTLFSHNDPVYLRIHAVCADAQAQVESLRRLCDRLEDTALHNSATVDERDREIERLRAENEGLRKLHNAFLKNVKNPELWRDLVDAKTFQEKPWTD